MYYLYILKSKEAGHYYTGITNGLEQRLKRHNCGWVKATRASRPGELVYYEEHESHADACRRESYIKAQKSRVYIASLIEKSSSSGG